MTVGQRALRAVYWLAALGCLVLPACSAALPPPVRALCYAAADLNAQKRVDVECSIGDAGVPFAECPAHDEIMAELAKSQSECK